jgi:hypothetical protein
MRDTYQNGYRNLLEILSVNLTDDNANPSSQNFNFDFSH